MLASCFFFLITHYYIMAEEEVLITRAEEVLKAVAPRLLEKFPDLTDKRKKTAFSKIASNGYREVVERYYTESVLARFFLYAKEDPLKEVNAILVEQGIKPLGKEDLKDNPFLRKHPDRVRDDALFPYREPEMPLLQILGRRGLGAWRELQGNLRQVGGEELAPDEILKYASHYSNRIPAGGLEELQEVLSGKLGRREFAKYPIILKNFFEGAGPEGLTEVDAVLYRNDPPETLRPSDLLLPTNDNTRLIPISGFCEGDKKIYKSDDYRHGPPESRPITALARANEFFKKKGWEPISLEHALAATYLDYDLLKFVALAEGKHFGGSAWDLYDYRMGVVQSLGLEKEILRELDIEDRYSTTFSREVGNRVGKAAREALALKSPCEVDAVYNVTSQDPYLSSTGQTGFRAKDDHAAVTSTQRSGAEYTR